MGPSRVSERKYVKASDGSTEVTSLHAMYDPSALLRTGGVAMITRWYHDKSDDSVVVGFQFGRDKIGNPNYELREHQSDDGDEYTYDNLYRLTRTVYDDTSPETPTASPSASTTDDFDYDDIGNRETAYLKSANATAYLANAVNEYTKSTLSGTDSLYDSDAAGNLTRIAAAAGSDTDGDWRFYYDYENALTKAEKYVTDAWVTQGEYVRDAHGRRVEKVADGTTIRYYYDGMRAIEETEGTGSPTVERQYVFGNGIDEALVMYDENGGSYDAYYYLADPLWTVEALVDESADIVEAYAYRAYGEPTIKTADGGDGDWFDGDETTASSSSLGNTILFTGRQYDPETAFYYYRARIYDPIRGRFTSADPLGYIDAMVLFAYGRNSPALWTDPSGRAVKVNWGKGCTEDKRAKLQKYLDEAQIALNGAYAVFQKGPDDCRVKEIMKEWFDRTPDTKGYEISYNRVFGTIKTMRTAFNGKLCIACKGWYCGKTTYGYNLTYLSKTIVVCPYSFVNSKPFLFVTPIHEVSHAYALTKDHGYWDYSATEFHTYLGKKDKVLDLSHEELEKNADTYAFLIYYEFRKQEQKAD